MLYTQDRNKLRQFYADVWASAQKGPLIDPVESQVAEVIAMHPEYQHMISNPDNFDKDYTPEDGHTNPYLHMGMHIALQEQIATNRPAGIAKVHTRLAKKCKDSHEAEHQMMEALGRAIWEAQRFGRMPDEAVYLEDLKRLL